MKNCVVSLSALRRTFVAGLACALSAVIPSSAFALVKGADISWVPQMEATGRTWKNKSGVREDIVKIIKELGINTVRLRTWVNPSSDPANGHCSQSETIALAVRCKNQGLGVMIDFHYGDTWNSVGLRTRLRPGRT